MICLAGPDATEERLLLSGWVADLPISRKRDQRKQGGKDRQYAVIGQRGRPDGEVVLTELRHGALEHSAPRFAL
jgi:hypothetical protein